MTICIGVKPVPLSFLTESLLPVYNLRAVQSTHDTLIAQLDFDFVVAS